jgi:nucleoside-diphosphate-sugar epimerase
VNAKPEQAEKWEPQVSLEDGLAITYRWIAGELKKNLAPAMATGS